MRRALALVAALGFLAACGSSSRTAASLPGLTPAKLAELRTDAIRGARMNGDAHPSSVTVYATRHAQALIAAGSSDSVPGGQPVYLVVTRGHFLCYPCVSAGPTGAGTTPKPPKVDVIWSVDARGTLAGLDDGLGYSKNLRTDKLGPGLHVNLG